MAHLGVRISALLDGQLSWEETERAWDHVHTCHFCRDAVEREGWVKTRLAGLSFDAGRAPDELKGSLLGMPPGDAILAFAGARPDHRSRRNAGLAAIGGGAVGAAVVGVLALGAAPADAPTIERRAPVTQLVTPSQAPASLPTGIKQLP
jgi:hypothetical protein